MTPITSGQAIFLAGVAVVAYLWLLDKLAPSMSASRHGAEYGLRQEYPAAGEQSQDADGTTDIIFVHGLGADPTKTWRYGDVCWISQLFPQDLKEKGIQSVRLFTFNYDSFWVRDANSTRLADTARSLGQQLTGDKLFPQDLKEKGIQSSVRLFTFNYDSFWVRDANSTRLADTARSLGQQLTGDKLHGHDLVLVGHSYGGLVIKQALVDLPELQDRLKGVLFLGTPHHGSPFTRFGLLAARLLTPLDADVEIMRPLVAGNVDLKDLDDRFREHFGNTTRLYYRERRKMRRYLLGFIPWIREFVVPEPSATAGASFLQIIALDADHRGLNRFRNRADNNYQQVASELVKILSEKSRPLPDGPSCQGHWLVPFERNRDFVGRESLLQQLVEKIHPNRDEKYCQRTAVFGLGGVGKTQIALEAAFRIHDADHACSVFWVPAVDAISFELAYREIGRKLQIDGIEDDDADVKSLVKAALSGNRIGRWLLVVDHADDLHILSEPPQSSIGGSSLAQYLPFGCEGSVLLTTRNYKVAVSLAEKTNIVAVKPMEAKDAHQLLESNLNVALTAGSATQLLELLSNLPLAIKQASAYMNENQISTTEYLTIYESDEDETIYLLSREFEDLGRYDKIKNPIAATWMISFRQILRSDPTAADYLRFMSFLAERDIPRSLLPDRGKAKTTEAIGTLKAYSFITQQKADSFDMHRLVQLSARYWLRRSGELGKVAKETLRRLAQVFPYPEHENRDAWMRYLPHAQRILDFRKDAGDEKAEGELLFNVGESVYVLGKYHEAEQMHRQALDLREKVLGKEHPATLSSMNNLAVVLKSLGKYEEAERLHRQEWKLSEKLLGKEHPSTLIIMNNLAVVLESLGKYEEAERLHRQALDLREKALGKEHPSTLISMNNLAHVLKSLGKYEEAERLHRQALDLREKALGKEHPSTLGSMNNLAVVLESLGKYEEAERLHRQALDLREKALGKEHPSTLGSMNNLAVVLESLGKYEEAEQLHRQAWKLSEKALGKEHPSTLIIMNNLALVLERLGKYEEAERLHRQALDLREKVLGKEHPETLMSMNNLANVLDSLGKYEEAERLHRQALDLTEKTLGKEHPSTLASMNNLALVLDCLGKYEEAMNLMGRCVQLRIEILGRDHPDTTASLGKLDSWRANTSGGAA
ncbi:hypothetical protein HIM_09511 [Hirsutella minnesotensis 3608]|uniref:Uncharacterized protein n=1 Tax=Hirsutella minnesotensis 3608 TaxID=1043627 RepID=A0A0F7ZXP7_9HYPO|nr:hypothetical protein HIM_09511 [Hirsutella minnesotensis 3608]